MHIYDGQHAHEEHQTLTHEDLSDLFQRVRIAGRVLLRNLPKIHSQDLTCPLLLRCSSRSDHRLCLLVLARTSFIIAAEIKITVAQTTVVVAAGWLVPLRCKILGIHARLCLRRSVLCGIFATKRLGNSVQYNDTRNTNEPMSCCIAKQLFLQCRSFLASLPDIQKEVPLCWALGDGFKLHKLLVCVPFGDSS
jgi:hypothetical protein